LTAPDRAATFARFPNEIGVLPSEPRGIAWMEIVAMYAVIETGGKQYRVEEGELVNVERLPGEPGQSIDLDRVLMIGGGESVLVGTPVVAGARVVGQVVRQTKSPKLRIFTYKRRKKYARRMGHRQAVTVLRIQSIQTPA
jgi:large subunit ribosomal protein L21